MTKTKIAAILVGGWGLIVLISGALYVWAAPAVLAHAPNLPSAAVQPQPVPVHFAIPLLMILGAVLIRKTRRSAVKLIVWALAYLAAALPGYEVLMAIRASNHAEVLGRVRLASASLLYCLALGLFLALILVSRVIRTKKEANQASATSEPAPQPER